MTLEIEDELGQFLEGSDRLPQQAARELMVVELFRQRRISGGKAAEFLGMTRLGFIHRAGELGIPYFDMSAEKLAQETDTVGKLIVERGR